MSALVTVEAHDAGALGGDGEVPAMERFVRALYAADLACYPTPGEEVDEEHLRRVVLAWPSGFRLFMAATEGGLSPVGYTGFYPISESTLGRLERADPLLADRWVPPLSDEERAAAGDARACVYVFNYSLIEPLRRPPWSGDLLRRLAADLDRLRPRGLAAITVSASGARVAMRFGMKKTGAYQTAFGEESVYVGRGDQWADARPYSSSP